MNLNMQFPPVSCYFLLLRPQYLQQFFCEHSQLMYSPYYKQPSLTPITSTKYFNLHMFWQHTKRHNTEHWFINTTNMDFQVFRDMLSVSVSSRTTQALKMEATSSCATMVTFTNQHSATFQMIWIFINNAERTIKILWIWNNNNQHNNKRTAKNGWTILKQCLRAKSSSCCISVKWMAEDAGGI
jgi:hypothetical protein